MTSTLPYEKVKTFVLSRKFMFMVFMWGFTEATFFFIVPDILFCFAALLLPMAGFSYGLLSIVGTLVGGVVMYHLASVNPVGMHEFLIKIPGIPATMVQQVSSGLQENGLVDLLKAPFQGIPYKIFAVEAGASQINIFHFLGMSILSRSGRIIVLCLLCGLISMIFRESIKKHTKQWVLFYILFWMGFYGLYAYHIASKY